MEDWSQADSSHLADRVADREVQLTGHQYAGIIGRLDGKD